MVLYIKNFSFGQNCQFFISFFIYFYQTQFFKSNFYHFVSNFYISKSNFLLYYKKQKQLFYMFKKIERGRFHDRIFERYL